MTTPGDTALTNEQVAAVKEEQVVAEKAPEAPESDQVIYFWAEGRNQQFIVPSKEKGQDGKPLRGKNYASKNSVLKLSKKEDAAAIAKLDAHPKNEANGATGSRSFKKLASLSIEESEKGKVLNELMGYDQKTLAAMADGGIENERLSVGELISKIMDQNKKK